MVTVPAVSSGPRKQRDCPRVRGVYELGKQ
jgi:hypothetical protein